MQRRRKKTGTYIAINGMVKGAAKTESLNNQYGYLYASD